MGRRLFFLAALVLAMALGAGCASKHMQEIPPEAVNETAAADESSVVFLRMTSFGGGVQAPIGEILDTEVKFVGISSAWTKLLHKTQPGKHKFFVGGESASMLEADLDPGKIYYVEVDPNLGFFKARFSLLPLDTAKIASDSFKKDFTKCKWVTAGKTANQWFAENRASMEEKAKTAQKKFAKIAPEKQKKVLPSYGVEHPVR